MPLLILFFIIIGYVLLGGYMFYKSESWGYGNAAYFCVITLTTIGFGDFVPKPQRESSEVSPELRYYIWTTCKQKAYLNFSFLQHNSLLCLPDDWNFFTIHDL